MRTIIKDKIALEMLSYWEWLIWRNYPIFSFI